MPLLLAVFLALIAIGADSFVRNINAKTSRAAPLFETKDSKKEKRPWEFGRFLKTAGFYGALKPRIPIVSGIVKKLRTRNLKPQKFMPGDVIWSSSGGGRETIKWYDSTRCCGGILLCSSYVVVLC
jgi:hypothetical protein